WPLGAQVARIVGRLGNPGARPPPDQSLCRQPMTIRRRTSPTRSTLKIQTLSAYQKNGSFPRFAPETRLVDSMPLLIANKRHRCDKYEARLAFQEYSGVLIQNTSNFAAAVPRRCVAESSVYRLHLVRRPLFRFYDDQVSFARVA